MTDASIPALPDLILAWLQRTQHAGIDIVAVATHQIPQIGSLGFVNVTTLPSQFNQTRAKQLPDKLAQLLTSPTNQPSNLATANPITDDMSVDDNETVIESVNELEPSPIDSLWQQHISDISQLQPVKVGRIDDFVLISCLVTQMATQQGEYQAILGCVVAPPFKEHMLDIIQLSLGWLFYGFVATEHPAGERAKRLLDMTSDILGQPDAKAAAQEWVNQAKRWANDMGYSELGISLFQVIKDTPKWWVSANVAWTVKGSPLMQTAKELAAMAILEGTVQRRRQWWAYPMQYQGQVSGVLILDSQHDDLSKDLPSDDILLMLQASADLLEPILRQWRRSEQNLLLHSYHSSSNVASKAFGKGYLVYKILGILLILVLLAITLIPVDDVVTAPLYVEGDKRYTVTAPQQSYLIEVLARPGDSVKQGQLIAKLEDKDLKLEAAEINSQLEQSRVQFRQAMADMDAANSGLAVNQRQQAQSKLDLVNTKLARTQIVAPINGVIVSGDWQQKIGTPVEEGAELFQVADINKYRVILHVPDKDMDSLKIGQLGKMKLTSLPEQTFDFTVNRLTAIAEVKDGENGFTVEAKLDSIPPQINPGMQGVGKIIVGKTNLISTWTKSLIEWSRLKLWSIW